MSTYNFVVAITDYTSGTVTFTSSPFALARGSYKPATADEAEPFVEEAFGFRVMAGSAEANLAQLRVLQGLLRQAGLAQKDRNLARVYFHFKENAGAAIYRSEIIKGLASWGETVLDREYWVNNTQFGEVEFTRHNWWEGPETQIPLSNTNGTDNTTGLNIFNTNDGAGSSPNDRVNYADIDGEDVDGTLDGLTRIELKNTYSSDLLYMVWIGQNFTDPVACKWFWDANAASYTGSSVSSALGSGNNYVNVALVSGTEADLLTWTIHSSELDGFAGRMYKAMLRLVSTFNTNVRYRIRLKWKNSTIWESGLVSLAGAVYATAIRELATFKLPPWVAGLSGQDSIQMILRGYHTAGGTITISIDSLQLTPVDGWRQLAYVGYGATVNMWITDDGINNRLYASNGSGTNVVGNLVGYGTPISLRPGVDQRLYFQFHSNVVNQAELDRVVQAKLYYRPRRHSL